jgi:hypothetical protein
MKKILAILLLSCLFGGSANSKPLNPIDIVSSLNICDNLNSSLGQYCKNKLDTIKYFNGLACSINENKITYKDSDWEYSFTIVEQNEKEAVVQFGDTALKGTYKAEQLIKLRYSKQTSKWVPYSSQLISRSGPGGDKKQKPELIKNPKALPLGAAKSICEADFFERGSTSAQTELRKNEFAIFNQISSFNKLIDTKEFKKFLRNNLPNYKANLGVSNGKKITVAANMYKFLEYLDEDFPSSNNERYIFLAGVSDGPGSEKGVLWIDKETKIAIGMIIHYYFNEEPFNKYGFFLIFSKDFNNVGELPKQFKKDLARYILTVKLDYDGNFAVKPNYPKFVNGKMIIPQRNISSLKPQKVRFVNSANEISDGSNIFK